MRILICDDDCNITNTISRILKTYFTNKKIKCPEIITYNSGEYLLNDKDPMDIVFLDVEMPGFDGIYVGNTLKRRNSKIIIFIVTSYIEYLDAAMRFNVFRYLSKPIDKQRLFQNLDDALKLLASYNQKTAIETKAGVTIVSTSDIVYVEAKGRKVTIHTTSADYESIHTIQFWYESLPKNIFFRSHRSYIVNLSKVSSFNHELIYLAQNQFSAYLTRRNYSAFKNAYLLYLESTR